MSGQFTSASLYVGDLAGDVSEIHLFDIFSRIVPVASIRVCRDAVTRRSLGYAYVNFHSMADAERALDALNGSSIRGKACRIMWSQRDPSLRKSGVGNIFIKNLDKSIDHKALYDTFSAFGNILSCKIVLDENNSSRGHAFVHYETQEMADRAIVKVNGMIIGGKTVYVAKFVPKKERAQPTDEGHFTNVFVKNLEPNVDDAKLVELFQAYGPLTSSAIMYDIEGHSKCFGFVNFERHEDAQAAVNDLNGKVFSPEGKPLYVSRAQKKHEREALQNAEKTGPHQGVNLYVKNLDDDIDDERLTNEFSRFGNVLSAKVMRDEKQNSRGFGFVSFSNPEEASKAVAEMNGQLVGSKPLYVALAQKKDIRKAQLEAQFRQRGKIPMGAGNALPPNPLYASGVGPIPFYPQAPGFVYPPIPMQRRGWAGPPVAAPYGQPMPNYVVMPRQPRHGQRQGQSRRGGYNAGKRDSQPPNVLPIQQDVSASMVSPSSELQTDSGVQNTGDVLMWGEKLFPLISEIEPEHAGKITGMLLERYSSSPEELLLLLEDPVALNEKISEALEVLAQAELVGKQDV